MVFVASCDDHISRNAQVIKYQQNFTYRQTDFVVKNVTATCYYHCHVHSYIYRNTIMVLPVVGKYASIYSNKNSMNSLYAYTPYIYIYRSKNSFKAFKYNHHWKYGSDPQLHCCNYNPIKV